MRIVISNAFSLNMLDFGKDEKILSFYPISLKDVKAKIEKATKLGYPIKSVVGHADTAAIFSEQLDHEIPMNRQTYSFDEDEILIVGQYRGPRLEEGTTKLPEGASILWVEVTSAEENYED